MGTPELVTNRFTNSWDYAKEMYGYAKSLIGSLAASNLTIGLGTIDNTVDTTISLEPVSTLISNMPSAPDYPDRPADLADFETPTIPGAPSYSLPVKPTLTDITIPDFTSVISIPTFDTVIAPMEIDAPDLVNVLGYTSEASYDSDLLGAIRTKLLSGIEDGGTGLNATVEDDIWDRDRERNELALQDALDKATNQWSKLNWSLPDGLLASQFSTIQKEYLNKDLDRSRDIAIKQAELELQNTIEMLKMGIGLETVWYEAANKLAERTFNAAVKANEFAIEYTKVMIARYNETVEVYKAKAAAYQSFVQAYQGEVEAYRARIGGLQAVAQVNESLSKNYATEMSAVEIQAKIFETELKAVEQELAARRAQVDMFRAKIESYAATCNSLTSQYNGNVEGYKVQVGAWSAANQANIGSKDVQIRGRVAEIDATIRAYEQAYKVLEWQYQLLFEKAKASAELAAQVTGGALAAVSASATLGYSQSVTETSE